MIKDGDIWLDASPIKVGATDGKITLTGSIGSAAEKTRARTLAWVMGVNDVDDQGLKVEPWLAEKMRQATDKRSRTDDEISWNEYNSAAENAREGGATRVINKLKVE